MEMTFPAWSVRTASFGVACLLTGASALGGLVLWAAPANAEDTLHHVTYTIISDDPSDADIYYRDIDPPNWADYSHNPYLYSPKVEAAVGPGKPWVLDVMLSDPDQWAMVVATSGWSSVTPQFHCELKVDGVVVKTNDGPKGALCSIRNW
jgi:hypothetical protein